MPSPPHGYGDRKWRHSQSRRVRFQDGSQASSHLDASILMPPARRRQSSAPSPAQVLEILKVPDWLRATLAFRLGVLPGIGRADLVFAPIAELRPTARPGPVRPPTDPRKSSQSGIDNDAPHKTLRSTIVEITSSGCFPRWFLITMNCMEQVVSLGDPQLEAGAYDSFHLRLLSSAYRSGA